MNQFEYLETFKTVNIAKELNYSHWAINKFRRNERKLSPELKYDLKLLLIKKSKELIELAESL